MGFARRGFWRSLAAASLFLGATAVPRHSAADSVPFLLGDVNGDGKVNVADVTLALRIAVGILTPTPQQLAAADVVPNPGIGPRATGDGQVATADATRILRYVLGLIPDSEFQPAPVQFARQIQPLFTERCAKPGCHDSSTRASDMSLSPGEAWDDTADTPADEAPDFKRILTNCPNDAKDGSYLYLKINGAQAMACTSACGVRMPKDGNTLGYLTDAQIALVGRWIDEGAKNN